MVCFLINLRTTCPGMALPTVAWALPHQLSFIKIPMGLATGQIDEGIFSIEVHSSQMALVCDKVKKKKKKNLSTLLLAVLRYLVTTIRHLTKQVTM